MKYSDESALVEITSFGSVRIGDERYDNIDKAVKDLDRIRAAALKLHDFVMKADADYARDYSWKRWNAARIAHEREQKAARPDPDALRGLAEAMKEAEAACRAAGGRIP